MAGAALLLLGSSTRVVSSGRPASPIGPDWGDRSDLGDAARLSTLCSSANAIGVGLQGEYFATENWLGRPSAVRTDTTVEFDTPSTLSNACGLEHIGSVRWTGWIKAHVAGRFRFDGGSPQVRIFVSNIILSGPQTTSASNIQLSAGRYYPVRVEVNRISSGQQPIYLRWTVPYGAHYVIPRQLLFLPTDSVARPGA